MFDWTLRMPIWRTWSFLACQNILRKNMKRYKVVSSSKIFKMFLWSRRLRYGPSCWKSLPKIRKFSNENQQTESNLFFFEKKPFVSKCFPGHMECGVENSAKVFSPRNRQLFAHCPNVIKFCFLQNFSSKRSVEHVECLPRSSRFSFEVFVHTKVTDLKQLVNMFAKISELFR